MTDELILLKVESSPRLERLLEFSLQGLSYRTVTPQELSTGAVKNRRILFALYVDELGMGPECFGLLRLMRANPGILQGCVGSIIVDGAGELYTKQAAQAVTLAANLAGCMFPGKPLVEGTGSLYNQRVSAKRMECTLEEAYFLRSQELVQRLVSFHRPKFSRPKILMLHASDNRKSNTVAMGREVLEHLSPYCDIKTISLQNGAIYDCRGCSYKACLHYSQSGTCYYGGALPTEVFPAILECDAILLLCPNFNDSASANIMALINRMTNLLLRSPLFDKYLFSIVVSGYSGSDLVARQILGALCLNKTMMLPPNFCIFQTANDPGSAMNSPGIHSRLERWSREILHKILPETYSEVK